MLRIVLFLPRMDYGTMLNIVFFLSFTSGTALARLPESLAPESLAKAPSSLLSETHNKSVTVAVAVALAVALALAVGLLILGTCWWYCRKARPPTRTDEELKSSPGLWLTYGVKDLNAATNNFSKSNLVGEGAFASVYRADLGGNRIAAVKRLLKVDSTLFGAELSILLRLPRHPNLVNLLGICSDPDNQMIVFEYVANGTLFTRLHDYQGDAGPLSWASRKKILRQVAEALRHLHEKAKPPIIHRDVKSKNILLQDDCTAKLADFGIAKLGQRNNRSTGTTPHGTFGYMDPECVSVYKCSTKSDVYSFGVLLLELITGSKALIGTDALVIRTLRDRLSTDTNDILRIVDQSLPRRNERKEQLELLEMIRIANDCLLGKRDERPTMTEVVNRMDKIGNA